MESNTKPSEPSNDTKPSESADLSAFWRAGNLKRSMRLHHEHTLFWHTLGCNLEEHVQAAIPPLCRIADLNCGNDAWLNSLRYEIPGGLLGGFYTNNTNNTNSPTSAFSSGSISSTQLDIMRKPIPSELRHEFDVWEEMNPNFIIDAAVPGLQTTACETLAKTLQTVREKGEVIKFHSLIELREHFGAYGIGNDIYRYRPEPHKEDYTSWTETCLMAWEEATLLFPSKITEPDAPMTRELWVETWLKAVDETEKGVMLRPESVFRVVGRRSQLAHPQARSQKGDEI
ncbi:S-adenosyl-L-methionine-dependent methyltransferase [Nemania sp. FL0031]|nr:S-adenosyl-L-methionine-dependent methyltransferase [Nemania sp. FL0031]